MGSVAVTFEFGGKLEEDSELIFEWKEDKIGLKSGYSLTLYISDSPCGDASIYRRRLDGQEVEFTGAKRARVDKGINEGADRREPQDQVLNILRTKSGRSDLPEKERSTSMSCSDKICRWLHLGLQGALMAPFVESLYLDRIIVGKDPLALDGAQYEALRRALLSRSCGISRTPRLSIPDNVDCFHMGKCNVQHKLLIRKEEDTRGSSDGEELPCVEEVLKPSTLKSKRKVGRKSAGLGSQSAALRLQHKLDTRCVLYSQPE